MGYIRKTPAGTYRACWRDVTGRQPSKTFKTRREASVFLTEIESTTHRGTYVDPHAGRRVLFDAYATKWLAAQNHELTTLARDASNMKNHLLTHWGTTPVGKIGYSDVQSWATKLGQGLAPATVSQCFRLMTGVMGAAVLDRLIVANPCDGVRLPKARQHADTIRLIGRPDFEQRLLPNVPARYQPLVMFAGNTGLRWGECIGLRWSAISLRSNCVRVERVAIEINGNVSTKPYPKSAASRRVVPLPTAVGEALVRYRDEHGTGGAGEVFVNEAGGPLRRSLFRTRVWRPTLVRAGLLGHVEKISPHEFVASWLDESGIRQDVSQNTYAKAVKSVVRHSGPALRFHDLRHSYASWLIAAGVSIADVQRIMGHEQASTTLNIYTHVTDGLNERVLDALAAFSLPEEAANGKGAPESEDSEAPDQEV